MNEAYLTSKKILLLMLIAQHVLAKFHPIEKSPVCRVSAREDYITRKENYSFTCQIPTDQEFGGPRCVGPVREKVSLEHSAPVETQPSGEQDELKTLDQINRSK